MMNHMCPHKAGLIGLMKYKAQVWNGNIVDGRKSWNSIHGFGSCVLGQDMFLWEAWLLFPS